MRRRTVICAVATGLAGCSAGGEPTETPTEADYVDRFRAALSAGAAEFAAVRVRVSDGIARLTYETTALPDASRSTVADTIARETRAVASSFAAVVGAGWEVDRLSVTVEQSGSVVVTYHIERAWATDFNGQNRSADRYGGRIESTVERHDLATPTPAGLTETPTHRE